jgi:large subunit ribosomal protein L35
MPKLKTNRGAAKRFRKTATGYKHRKAFRNHILTKKSTKRKRQLRGLDDVAAADVPALRRMLPKKAR